MNFPRYRAGPVEYWLGEAFTEFVNGFIKGWGAGIGTGVTTGTLTGTTSAGMDMTALNQVLISAVGVIGAMAGSGINQVWHWHQTGHAFPNPWKPTGNTPPPFPPKDAPPPQ